MTVTVARPVVHRPKVLPIVHCQWELSFNPFGDSVLCMETRDVETIMRADMGTFALCPPHKAEYEATP